MENQIKNINNKWAIKINEVSRLFFNTTGEPIAAVNSVSLGIQEGSIFGFLGANGSGKTTLMKMIISLLPISNGSIEINGVDIKNMESSPISLCPQFNSHLCEEMTIYEHFQMYSKLYSYSNTDLFEKSEFIIEALNLKNIKE